MPWRLYDTLNGCWFDDELYDTHDACTSAGHHYMHEARAVGDELQLLAEPVDAGDLISDRTEEEEDKV